MFVDRSSQGEQCELSAAAADRVSSGVSQPKQISETRSQLERGAKSGGPPSLPRATPELGKIIAYRQTDRATQSEALLQRIAAPIWISLLSPPALPAPRGRRCKIPAASEISSQDRPQRAFESATELCYCRIKPCSASRAWASRKRDQRRKRTGPPADVRRRSVRPIGAALKIKRAVQPLPNHADRFGSLRVS